MLTVADTAGAAYVRPPSASQDRFRSTRGGHLTRQTIDSLARYFAMKDHRPSPEMWAALVDLAVTLERMAVGDAAPKFYLSSLDPGVGKTQTITHFVDALLSSPDYSDVGVLVCVARLAEVETIIHDMAIPA